MTYAPHILQTYVVLAVMDNWYAYSHQISQTLKMSVTLHMKLRVEVSLELSNPQLDVDGFIKFLPKGKKYITCFFFSLTPFFLL